MLEDGHGGVLQVEGEGHWGGRPVLNAREAQRGDLLLDGVQRGLLGWRLGAEDFAFLGYFFALASYTNLLDLHSFYFNLFHQFRDILRTFVLPLFCRLFRLLFCFLLNIALFKFVKLLTGYLLSGNLIVEVLLLRYSRLETFLSPQYLAGLVMEACLYLSIQSGLLDHYSAISSSVPAPDSEGEDQEAGEQDEAEDDDAAVLDFTFRVYIKQVE